jgi:hypothetical protein
MMPLEIEEAVEDVSADVEVTFMNNEGELDEFDEVILPVTLPEGTLVCIASAV